MDSVRALIARGCGNKFRQPLSLGIAYAVVRHSQTSRLLEVWSP